MTGIMPTKETRLIYNNVGGFRDVTQAESQFTQVLLWDQMRDILHLTLRYLSRWQSG